MKRVLLLLIFILTLSCSKDNIQEKSRDQSYTLVFTTTNLEQSVTVSAGTEITYESTFEFINSEYDTLNNTITIETELNPVKIDTNFYIENGSEVSIILYNYEGNIIDEKTITQINYNYIYQF